MFVTNDLFLIRNGHSDISIFVQEDALTRQAGSQFWVSGPIDKIFLFIRYLFNKLITV